MIIRDAKDLPGDLNSLKKKIFNTPPLRVSEMMPGNSRTLPRGEARESAFEELMKRLQEETEILDSEIRTLIANDDKSTSEEVRAQQHRLAHMNAPCTSSFPLLLKLEMQ